MSFNLNFIYIITRLSFGGNCFYDNAAIRYHDFCSSNARQGTGIAPKIHRTQLSVGGQRSSALKVGLLGAYLGRGNCEALIK